MAASPLFCGLGLHPPPGAPNDQQNSEKAPEIRTRPISSPRQNWLGQALDLISRPDVFPRPSLSRLGQVRAKVCRCLVKTVSDRGWPARRREAVSVRRSERPPHLY